MPDLRPVGERHRLPVQLQDLRESDADVDATLSELERSDNLYLIVQQPGGRGGLTIGGNSPLPFSRDEQDIVDADAAALGVTDKRVRGISYVSGWQNVPAAWIAGHEAIHLLGIERRFERYRHDEPAFAVNRRHFLAAGYRFPR